jgi:adenylate cyclase
LQSDFGCQAASWRQGDNALGAEHYPHMAHHPSQVPPDPAETPAPPGLQLLRRARGGSRSELPASLESAPPAELLRPSFDLERLNQLADPADDKQATILVVDDSRTLRRILIHSLKSQGYHDVVEAVDGLGALEAVQRQEFDLMLLDIEMPVLDGFEVLRRIKADPQVRDLPVVVISGLDKVDGIVRAIEMGAEDYLPKPYNPTLLRARVTSSLEKKRLRDLDRLRVAELQREKQLLELEQERSDRLLLNVLPRAIAERLKQGESTIAEAYSAVTVLFADLVDFTTLSSYTEPEDLVRMLNKIFTEFDNLVERYGVEKIKTIGDSYMVVGGLPLPHRDHAGAIANLALDMLAAIEMINIETQSERAIRIGIHTGPVVAGIIGQKKFAYDLWGQTVNIAARLESGGLPGHIHVSQETRDLICDRFALAERGVIQAKGVGEIRTYFLQQR